MNTKRVEDGIGDEQPLRLGTYKDKFGDIRWVGTGEPVKPSAPEELPEELPQITWVPVYVERAICDLIPETGYAREIARVAWAWDDEHPGYENLLYKWQNEAIRQRRDLIALQEIREYEQDLRLRAVPVEERTADLLARFLEAREWSIFTSDDPEIMRLRGIAKKVYAEHRDKDFTRARIESTKAVILEVLKQPIPEERTAEMGKLMDLLRRFMKDCSCPCGDCTKCTEALDHIEGKAK